LEEKQHSLALEKTPAKKSVQAGAGHVSNAKVRLM